MALVIYDATGYDSFCTVAEANTTVASLTLYNTTWTALSDAEKEVYLRIAFRVIVDGFEDITEIENSDCLKEAQALIAVNDLVTGLSADTEATTGAVKKQKAGVVEVQYYEPSSDSSGRTVIVPSMAMPCLIALDWDGNTAEGGFKQTTLGHS